MGDDPNQRGGSRRWIMREVENSLRRLGTDHIDLYQVHRPDPDTDVEETLGALTDLVRQGKVRYIGSSSYSGCPDRRGPVGLEDAAWSGSVTEQPPYSILVRGIEEDVLPTAATPRHGHPHLQPARRRLALGRWRKDAAGQPTSAARPSALRHERPRRTSASSTSSKSSRCSPRTPG